MTGQRGLGLRTGWMLALLWSACFNTAFSAEVVIGNANLKIDKLTREQVADLFLRKTNHLPDATVVTVFDHKDDEFIKKEFYRKVLGMSLEQLRAYWSKEQFAQQVFPPLAYGGDEAVKRLVGHTPGGIGYIEAGSVDGSVKVLFKP